jgi:hypothetical protein
VPAALRRAWDRVRAALKPVGLTAGSAGKPKGMARLDDYSFGRLTVDGREHTRDLSVLPDRLVDDC